MSLPPRSRLLPLSIAVVAIFAIAGCGGDDDSDTTTDTANGAEEAAIEQDLSTKPEVEIPEGDPPGELETTDLLEGDGKQAKGGDTVRMQYVGVDFATGEEFDASWNRGEPFEFELGAGMVIAGWDEGIPGMREGGRRTLVIPPEMAYGAAGAPPAIGPNATLVFVVDLIKVK